MESLRVAENPKGQMRSLNVNIVGVNPGFDSTLYCKKIEEKPALNRS